MLIMYRWLAFLQSTEATILKEIADLRQKLDLVLERLNSQRD